MDEIFFAFVFEKSIFLSLVKHFRFLFLKNQCSSPGRNISFFCLWKCISSNALLTLNEKMQRTAHAEKIIRLKLNLIKSFAREMQPCLIAKGKNIHLWRKSNVKKDNRNRCNPVEIWNMCFRFRTGVLHRWKQIFILLSYCCHLLSSSSLFVLNQTLGRELMVIPHPSCQIQIFWQS